MVEGLVLVLTGYVVAGVVFAIVFVVFGVQQIDSAAAAGTRGFRMVILPGAAALWPLLLMRWLRRSPPPTEKTAHRRLSGATDGELGERG